MATDLIPTLDGSSNGAEDNGIIERPRVLPSMCYLLSQSLLLILFKVQALKASRVLCYEGTLLKKREDVVRQAFGPLKLSNIGEESVSRNSLERVTDFTLEVVGQSGQSLARLSRRVVAGPYSRSKRVSQPQPQ